MFVIRPSSSGIILKIELKFFGAEALVCADPGSRTLDLLLSLLCAHALLVILFALGLAIVVGNVDDGFPIYVGILVGNNSCIQLCFL
jgi:hypothetical protein